MTKLLCIKHLSGCKCLEGSLTCQDVSPFNKFHGIRPIGIGEVLRRIMGETVMLTIKKDVVQAAGPLQVCASQEACVASAAHSMIDLFECNDSTSVVQIDAANAFNSFNRNVFFHNIKIISPEIEKFILNVMQAFL